MKVTVKKIDVVEKTVDVRVGRNIYLIVLRYTSRRDGCQSVSSMTTFDHKGIPPYREGYNADVLAVFEYRLTDRELVPAYEVHGGDYLKYIE